MKPKTRDNLIYLSVGLGIAALVAVDAFYSDCHGREMWIPSKLAFRAVYSTGLLAYYLGREMCKAKATLVQVLAGILFSSVVHLGIIFVFRQAVGQLPAISFLPLVILEMFFVGVLSEQAVLRLIPGQRELRR